METVIPYRFHYRDNIPYMPEAFEKAIKKGEITATDKEYIILYIETKMAEQEISNARTQKIATTLLGWRKTLLDKPYDSLTYPDILPALRKLQTGLNQRGTPFAQNTKHDYVVILKPFLRWMVKEKFNSNLTLDRIDDIKNPAKNMDTKHPEDFLEPEELVRLLSCCYYSRDRALIAMHYELGARISEMARLRWKDIIPNDSKRDDYGARVLILDKKTKKTRMGIITPSVSLQYLNIWRLDYPGEASGENPVFVTLTGEPRSITYPLVRRVYLRAAEKAGLTKKVTTHLLRGTRITHLVEQGLSENILKESMWGNQSTDMLKVYVHIKPEEQIKAMLRHQGIEVDDNLKARVVEGQFCTQCRSISPPTGSYCMHCGSPFDSTMMQEGYTDAEQAIKDVEILCHQMKIMETKIKEIRSAFNVHPEEPVSHPDQSG